MMRSAQAGTTVSASWRFWKVSSFPSSSAKLPGSAFLPGIAVVHGVLAIDEGRLLYPAKRVGLDPAVVFHDAGYRGGAGVRRENFLAGR
jgi:hypothetical protein